MRAGSLNRTIILLAYAVSAPDEYGNVTEGWQGGAAVRAQVVSLSTEEFLKSSGETSTAIVVFRIRWRDGVANDQRIDFEGRQFDIKEATEIGHRDGLELRCEERRS